ncbi:MAG: serpin family protein [Niabella sp.]
MMKNLFLYASFSMMLLTAIGCSKNNSPEANKKQQSNIQHPIELATPVANVFTDFSFGFFKTLQAETDAEKDIFVSPLSLHIALGMLLKGAQGTTKEEMMQALKAEGISQDELNKAYNTLLTELPQADDLVKLAPANAIFYKNGLPVETSFLTTMKNTFNAQVTGLPFVPADLVTINQWASDHTNGKIPKVLDEIDPNLVMLLMNALYFKGDWRSKFDKANTEAQPFYPESGTQTTVKMMHQTDTFQLAASGDFTALQLPYGNGQFRATLLLPNEGKSIADVFSGLSITEWTQLQSSFYTQSVEVGLPRFKLEQEFELNNTLQKMGMIKAFDAAAELEGISNIKPLYVSFVKQNTFAAVDEEGTEAAAVTTIGIVNTSVPVIPQFICNRPFGFIISEKTSNTILFMGRIMQPQD